jgi:TPR repeat protein
MRSIGVMVVWFAVGCGSSSPKPDPGPTPGPTPSPSPKPDPGPTPSPSTALCSGRASCLAACSSHVSGACLRLARVLQLRVEAQKPPPTTPEIEAALAAACDGGDVATCGEMADLYCVMGGDNRVDSCRPQSLAVATRACDGGDAQGCFHLGMMHERGVLDMAESDADAAPFYRKSLAAFDAQCGAGDSRACLFEGGQYLQSRGAADMGAAGPFFERAFTLATAECKAGDPIACMTAAIAAGGSGHQDRVKDLVTAMCGVLEPDDCAAWKAANPGAIP